MILEADIDPSPISEKAIGVIGFGNQGRAHALNLRDRGLSIRVGARSGRGRDTALADGFDVSSIEDTVRGSDLVVMTLPDESMGAVYGSLVAPHLTKGAVLVFAHGFALTYGTVVLPAGGGAVLVSPSGPGTALRERFLTGSGLPGFVAAEPAALMPLALAYGWAIGCARAGLIATTFREETECDLFGEQTVLCGGMPELAMAAFETLVEAGYNPDVAYTECVQQVRLLADLMARHGVAGMKERISDTAEWGSYGVGPKVIGKEAKAAMLDALERIRSGEFARGWIAEAETGKPTLKKLRSLSKDRAGEAAFKRLNQRSTDPPERAT